MGQIGYCWRRNEDIPDALEPESIAQQNPLFADALGNEPLIDICLLL